ncbi:hypothetical protein GOP47_0027341 [Adiantum capillus-veneris]|nr:hypothetical protein GOP47_0027341 [Adiantum capillus-veneris]
MTGFLRKGVVTCLLVLSLCVCAGSTSDDSLSEDGRALISFLFEFPEGCPVRAILSRSWIIDPSASDGPCSWQGITCDPFSHRVVSVDLSFLPCNATSSSCSPASLPPYLASLTHLQNLSLPFLNLSCPFPFSLAANPLLRLLNLSHNALSGPLPSSLCAHLPFLAVLDLQSNQLSGSIPPDIGLCKNLVSLSLQDNNLSGSIPPSIGQLSNLETFHAGGNTHLSGSLPSELGNCSSLVEFGFTETSISGIIPPSLGHLSNLKYIFIQTAHLSGNIPPELGNCSSLEHIDIDDNKLVGPIPPQLSKLTKLKWFNLWGNGLSGAIPPELGLLESLEMIDLSQNQLVGTIPSSFGRLTKLSNLHLGMNYLSGAIPAELGNCSNLMELQLDRNRLSKAIPAELGKLSKLQGLHLWNNSLEGEVPATLANCNELIWIDLSWNLLMGSLDSGVFSLPSLKHIIAVGNNFSGKIPSTIAKCKQLIRLRLDMNRLTGSIPRELGELTNLTVFDISRNQISGGIPDVISNCRALQRFDAHENLLQGSIPAELGSLSNLVYLDLSYNRLAGPLPETLSRLHNLSVLIVSSNRLSGVIPAEWRNCQKLTYLDLSSNSLSGTIPSSLGQISSLGQALNVCCNSLSGTIPDSFAQLMSLAALDVSHNTFSGHLDVFSKMGSLITLNISNNLFCGPFPSSTLFESMPKSNYASCFAAANECSGKRGTVRNKAIFLLLLGPMGLIVIVSCALLYSLFKRSNVLTEKHKSAVWAPWLLTPFQKLHFTMQDILDRMSDTNIIGKGSSGVVYKAVMPKGEVIAVKKMIMASSMTRERFGKNLFRTEMETLRTIRHRNIVRLLGFCSNHETSLLLYNYMVNGSLEECIHKRRGLLDWDARYNVALGAAQGLAYLHHDCMPSILHRDVKASNILLGAHFEPYLADFGLAKSTVNASCASQTVLAGSYGYIAPEYAYTLNITEKSDVYSYGVVLLEMLTGKRPVEASLGEGRHLTEWVHEMRHITDDVVDILDPRLRGMADPFVKEMLQTLMLALDCVHPLPAERPSMRDVVTLLLHIRQPHLVDNNSKLDPTKLDALVCHTTSSYPSTKHVHATSFSSPHNSNHLSITRHSADNMQEQSKGSDS